MTDEKREWLESIGARFHEEDREWRYTIASSDENSGWRYVIPEEFAEESTLEEMQKEHEANVKKAEWSAKIKSSIRESGYKPNGMIFEKSKNILNSALTQMVMTQRAFETMNKHERCCIVLEYDQKALNAETYYYVYDPDQESSDQ